MAAIAGHLQADCDAPADRRTVDAMLQRLVGPPGAPLESWTSGGDCLACVGRNAGNLRAAGDRLKIVVDARLDDREALAERLGCDRALPDAALILAAYRHWGVDCAGHLVGDFAFAIWDTESRSLYAARDLFGVKPLYHRGDRNGLAFASRLDAVARPRDRLDRSRLAAYLAGLDDDPADTVLAEVHRLPMGHWLHWTRDRQWLQRYAQIAPEPLSHDQDFAAGFRERFLAAVDARTLGTADLGAMLSGGLDSSSIVSAVGRRGVGEGAPLRTFSFAYPRSPALDESDYAASVLAEYPVVSDFVSMDNFAPLEGLADLADGSDDLFFAPGLPKITSLLARARKAGVRVMLDGHGGDEVVSFGYGRLADLARQRRWATLYHELRGVAAESGRRAEPMLIDAMLSQGLLGRLRSRVAPRRSTAGPGSLALLNLDFARSQDLAERMRQSGETYRLAARSESSLHLWNVAAPGVSRAFETLRRAGDQVGIELRFPFYDQRLVRFALAVPEHEKLKDGWSRSILRRAMADILPDKVRWRRGKVDFGAELATGLVRHHGDLLDALLRDGAPVEEYIDLVAARRIVADLRASWSPSGSPELFALWRAIFVALWLSNRSAALSPARVLS